MYCAVLYYVLCCVTSMCDVVTFSCRITCLRRRPVSVRPPAVQLTWMAYDLVALRTGPEPGLLMRKLAEAHRTCRAAVCGDRDQEQPEPDDVPEPAAPPPAATTPTRM